MWESPPAALSGQRRKSDGIFSNDIVVYWVAGPNACDGAFCARLGGN